MQNKRLLLIVSGLLLIAAAVTAFIVWPSESSTEKTIAPKPSSVPKTNLSADAISELEQALNSDDLAEQSQVLAPGLDAQYRAQGITAFTPETRVTLEPESVRQTGDYAHIEARLSNGEQYLVHLVKQADRWYIWHTEKR